MKQNQKKMYGKFNRFNAIFLILLILTMPVYSASALAAPSVAITKNTGEAQIENFIDANGDVWKVQAQLSGLEGKVVESSDVKLKIGNRESTFSSCTNNEFGVLCEYLSPLTNGVRPDDYTYQVILTYLDDLLQPKQADASGVVRADGTNPVVENVQVVQNRNGQLTLDFTVKDNHEQDSPSVGLDTLQVIDPDSNEIVVSLSSDIINSVSNFQFSQINPTGNVVDAQLTGDGLKRIKIIASDKLGHQSDANKIYSYKADFVSPQIDASTLNFTELDRFIGQFLTTTDITIQVEDKNFNNIVATSQDARLNNKLADRCDEISLNLYECTWKDVQIEPKTQYNINFVATDDYNNAQTTTASLSGFVVDNNPPTIEYLGSAREYQGKSFLKQGKNTIILIVKELESGIEPKNIIADMGAFSRSDSKPDGCNRLADGLECYWDVDFNTQTDQIEFRVKTLKDNAGNEAQGAKVDLFVDNGAPVVEEIELLGYSDTGDRIFFQSNDQIKVQLTVKEINGLFVRADLNDVVLDAHNYFDNDNFTRRDHVGWQDFNQDECVRDEGTWICEFLTKPIMSGPASARDFKLEISDTAGNIATIYES